jgi:hypothetical protein
MYTRPLSEILVDLKSLLENVDDKAVATKLKKHIKEIERVDKIIEKKNLDIDYAKPVRAKSSKPRKATSYNVFVKKAFDDAKLEGVPMNFTIAAKMWQDRKKEEE